MRLPNSLNTSSNRRDMPEVPDDRRSLGCLPLALVLVFVPLAWLLAVQPTAASFNLLFLLTLAPVGFVPHLGAWGLPDHWTVTVSCVFFSGYLMLGVLPAVVKRKWFSLASCAALIVLFFFNVTGCREVIDQWQPGWENYDEIRQLSP